MKEWGEGKLHSGSKTGPVVKSQKQALAIGYSEKRKSAHDKALSKSNVVEPKAETTAEKVKRVVKKAVSKKK